MRFPTVFVACATAMIAAAGTIVVLISATTKKSHIKNKTAADNYQEILAESSSAPQEEKTKLRRLQVRAEQDVTYDKSSKNINNDVEWKDNNGNLLDVSRGGKISKIDGVFWWVGTKPFSSESNADNGDVYLYKSYTFGSNSWEFVRKLVDSSTQEKPGTGGNCQLHKHPSKGTYHLHCKRREFYISDSIEGEFVRLPEPQDPSNNGDDWRWGANYVYQDNNEICLDEMYLVTTMSLENADGTVDGTTRTLYIFKMNEAWTGFDPTTPIVASWSWPKREGLCLFKEGSTYFLTASRTAGWRDSFTWFRSANTLEQLSQATDVEVLFSPENTRSIKSMGSQHRQIIEVSSGKWIFMGSRHPDEDPMEYDSKYGRNIAAPVRFIDGVPNVYWKYQFDLDTYDFTSGEYDNHSHGGYGHSPSSSSSAPSTVPTTISSAPSSLASPTGKDSDIPSMSLVPSSSSAPSIMPTISSAPSSSASPTAKDSGIPSMSLSPSSSLAPSTMPTISSAPSSSESSTAKDSEAPSMSGAPSSSSAPSIMPSISSAPSSSASPTAKDSDIPSMSRSPSYSSVPSTVPSISATSSSSPSTQPSQASSSVPSITPSASSSTAPSLSLSPTVSAAPSLRPTISSSPSKKVPTKPSGPGNHVVVIGDFQSSAAAKVSTILPVFISFMFVFYI